MLESMLNAFRAPDIRRRLLFVALILIGIGPGARSIPGINPASLNARTLTTASSDCCRSSGARRRMSIVGLGPTRTSTTIIMQILQTIPSLKALASEGEYAATRYQLLALAVRPLAALQAYGILAFLQPTSRPVPVVVAYTTPFSFETYSRGLRSSP